MTNIAFLGLGQMGAPLARRLAELGHNVALWNRDRTKAHAIARIVEQQAHVAASPAEAVADVSAVFTMLADDAALEAVLFGNRLSEAALGAGFIDALPPGAIHVTLSTISVPLARRITAAHQERGQQHVAAPVFGRPIVAEQGKLWIVAAAPEQPLAQVRPLLEQISRGLTIVSSEPWQAHALKLGGNFTITAMIQTLAEAFVFASSQGIDPAVFHQAINSALFQSPLYDAYGRTILNPPEPPGATVMLGVKDTGLLRQAAAGAGIHLPLADYFAGVLERAREAGFADQDWAVGQYRIAQSDATRHQNTSPGLERIASPVSAPRR
jgi:3-hydroxyisobutyrate dehydrogenase-like beta-hydroxyacid dehydrogenase